MQQDVELADSDALGHPLTRPLLVTKDIALVLHS